MEKQKVDWKNKEEVRNYHRKKLQEWRKKNPEKNKELRNKYKKTKKGITANNSYSKKYYHKGENNKKQLIRTRDYRKLRKKLLDKTSVCEFCGSNDYLELHHENYIKEGCIKVLCRKCHRQFHKKN